MLASLDQQSFSTFLSLVQFVSDDPAPLTAAYQPRFEAARDLTEIVRVGIDLASEVVERNPRIRTLTPAAQPEGAPRRASSWRAAAELFRWITEQGPIYQREFERSADLSILASLSEVVGTTADHIFRDRTVNTMVKAALSHRFPARAIDFGAGNGYLSLYLASLGCDVTAIEPNPLKRNFIEFCCPPESRCRVLDRVDEGTYDAVFSINVFDHIPDATEVVEQLVARLATGGILYYVAQFPNDGFHTSDASVIDRVFTKLHTLCEATFASPVPLVGFEVMRKRERPAEQPLGADSLVLVPSPHTVDRLPDLYPVLHPTINLDWRDAETLIAHSPLFYIRETLIPRWMGKLLLSCDGRRTVTEIESALVSAGARRAEVRSGLLQMWEKRVLGMRVPVR